MSNISKRRKEGSKAKIKSMGDHKEFLKRITKTLYYGQLPTLPCLSLPVTEISCELWSMSQRGRSLRRLHADAAAGLARGACVSPCALVLAILYLERLNACNPDYLTNAAPADLFLVSLMVGNKFLQDDGEDDEVLCSEWAASGGIELGQLKKLELEFLNAINWNVFVNERSFETGLRWLERRVALKQARGRGFFTYSDLAAASAPLVHVVRAAAAAWLLLALAYVAAVAALLAVAPAPRSPALHSPALHSPAPHSPALHSPAPHSPAPHSPAPHSPALHSPAPHSPAAHRTHELPANFNEPPAAEHRIDNNQTATFLVDDASMPLCFRCCTNWMNYYENTIERKRFDTIVIDSRRHDPWWSRTTSVLNRLYLTSLVNPLRRWLEKVNEYTELVKRRLTSDSGPLQRGSCTDFMKPNERLHCVHQWLNLSKLNMLVTYVSDR